MRAATRKWDRRAGNFLQILAEGQRRGGLRDRELAADEANVYAGRFTADPRKRRKLERAIRRRLGG